MATPEPATATPINQPQGSPPAHYAPQAQPPVPPATVPRQLPLVAPPANVIVYITDITFVGPHVTVPLRRSVTWVNLGSAVHTATAIGPIRPFDTGGLNHGQSATTTFMTPGTYAYTSAPDCVNHKSGFDCAGSFTVTVTA